MPRRPAQFIVSNLTPLDKPAYDEGWRQGQNGVWNSAIATRLRGAAYWGYRDAVAHYRARAMARPPIDADFLPRQVAR